MSALNASVYRNSDNTLGFISNLLQEEFGVNSNAEGTCLIAQVVYSICAVTGISPAVITEHIDEHVGRVVDEKGHTLDEILLTLKQPIHLQDGRVVLLDVKPRFFTALPEVIGSILDGVPVIFAIGSSATSAITNEALSYDDGEVVASVIRPSTDGNFHALLGIGVDSVGYIILRENRHTYGFKGYLKVHVDVLEPGLKHVGCFAVEVHAITIRR